MEGSNVGIWVAHGEGRCHFPDEAVELAVLEGGLAPLRYTDAQGRATETYPFNPNGSPHGIAALCSADGRHLAMMPHPERCAPRCAPRCPQLRPCTPRCPPAPPPCTCRLLPACYRSHACVDSTRAGDSATSRILETPRGSSALAA